MGEIVCETSVGLGREVEVHCRREQLQTPDSRTNCDV